MKGRGGGGGGVNYNSFWTAYDFNSCTRLMPESMRNMQRPGTTAPQQPWMSLLNSSVIVEVGMYSGVAARAAEFRKQNVLH